MASPHPHAWSRWSWQSAATGAPAAWPSYVPGPGLDETIARLEALPPLVTSGEVEKLRTRLAEAAEGRAFILWGGDCAETFADCTAEGIAARVKVLLQMALVLRAAGDRPVVRIGRIAGQYAKPRSSPTETRRIDGREVTLPSYFGELFNRAEFSAQARTADPALMIEGHRHAAMTLNFIRALLDGGFADLHHPENWDLGFLARAGLLPEQREQYRRLADRISKHPPADPGAEEFFTSHEGLNLHYEAAQTRPVPRRAGMYDLTTHLPWIGQRTGDPAGPHVEFFRGVANPVGLKIGPEMTPAQLAAVVERLDPAGEPGRVVLVPRLGVAHFARVLPGLVEAVERMGRRGLWVCDPMHGNGMVTASGVKTRSFDDVLAEIAGVAAILGERGQVLAGVHVEVTPLDVTECIGGAAGITEVDLARNYASLCDPRLNYEQGMELAFAAARVVKPEVSVRGGAKSGARI